MDNLYDILGLTSESTKEEIKQSYKRLAKIYHPDKCVFNNDRFITIKNAYDILYDDEKRKIYDNLNSNEDFLNSLNNYFKENIPDQTMQNIKDAINVFFDDQDFKSLVTDGDLTGIFTHVYNKLKHKMDKMNPKMNSQINPETNIEANIEENIGENNELNIEENNEFNIEGNIEGIIYTTLEEKYNDKYRKLLIKRTTREDKIIFVPLKLSKFIMKNEGEYLNEKNVAGDIIIQIESIESINSDIIVENYDIYLKWNFPWEISLSR